jgi:hypothetical protein
MLPRGELLRHNQFLRATNGARDLSFARLALQIPEEDHARLVVANPALASKDAKERTRAWEAFMRDPASEPYRVRDRI